MLERICPKCRSSSSARIKRVGLLQTVVLPLFGLYPWECSDCRRTFFLKARGKPHSNPAAESRTRSSQA